MPRVIGIDPGTLTVDVCGLDEGHVFLDQSFGTKETLTDPSTLISLLDEFHRNKPLDLVAGPSGYGLPLKAVNALTDFDLQLAVLASRADLKDDADKNADVPVG